MASSTQQPELELFRRSLNAILPHSVSGMLHYDVKICLALCTYTFSERITAPAALSLTQHAP